MADPRDYLQETQKISDETESRSIEELKETEDLGIGTRHQEVLQFLQQQRLRDVEMQRRSQETESRSIKEPEDKEDSVLRRNEAEYLQQYRRQRDCRYNHPTQLPQDLPERSCVPMCKHFLKGYCRFGSVCKLQHIEDRNLAEHMYQEARMNRIIARENLQQQRCQIQPTVVSEQDLLKKNGFTDFEGSFLGRNRYPMMQQQQFAQSQQHQSLPSDPFEQMQTPESMNTPQPQQHQSLASHPVTELRSYFDKCQDLLNSISRPGLRFGLKLNEVTELNSHFEKCQQLLNSLSRPLGSKRVSLFHKYVDGQEQNHHLSQLLQERKALIEEYKKSVEEIVKLSSIYFS